MTSPEKEFQSPLEELIDESFEGSYILKLYQAYVGSTKSISLSVEEILVNLLFRRGLIFILWINIFFAGAVERSFSVGKNPWLRKKVLFLEIFFAGRNPWLEKSFCF